LSAVLRKYSLFAVFGFFDYYAVIFLPEKESLAGIFLALPA